MWVVRMVEGRGIRVPEKTLYWWSVHFERFLKFCRRAGAESSEVPEVAARLFLESLPVGGSAEEFAGEEGRMVLDVFNNKNIIRSVSIWRNYVWYLNRTRRQYSNYFKSISGITTTINYACCYCISSFN